MNENTILGISPGTRFIGLAVLDDGILRHWQVRSFTGVWSDEKLRSILGLIDDILYRYGVNQVCVKVPDVLPLTKGFHQLVGAINVLCENNAIRPRYYSLSEIKKHHCRSDEQTRDMLIKTMVQLYPDLALEYRREMRNRNAYYYKLFEAVAVAKMD